MKKPREFEIVAVATKLEQIASIIKPSSRPEWSLPISLKIIDCVLSLHRNYDKFVVPKRDAFKSRHPETKSAGELSRLISCYPTPHEFVLRELDYDDSDRARVLHSVVTRVCAIVERTPAVLEEDSLRHWAMQAQPDGYKLWGIKGFGPAGFNYMRMLFGAETTKPDEYICRFVSNILGRNVSPLQTIVVLEAAAQRVGFSIRDVDTSIWETSHDKTQET